MSVFNGFKDVLVRKDGDRFLVDGLSPAGFAYIEENLANVTTAAIHPVYIGEFVSQLINNKLAVEVR